MLGIKSNRAHSLIFGHVNPEFRKVKEEFVKNFEKREEIGASCCIYYKGEKVVDLWGGYRDYHKKEVWNEDTMVLVFSATKGFSALAIAVAHSKGNINYDEKVSTYWPEFKQNEKENITVRQLLSHQAGLCTIDQLPLNKLIDFDTQNVVNELAKMKPLWIPGQAHGYHAWTFGWLISELIKRTDPKSRSVGQFIQDEISRPLNAEFYIGLPEEIGEERVATIIGIETVLPLFLNLHRFPKRLLFAFLNKKSLTSRSMVDPKGLLAHSNFNKRELRSVEFPSGNGIGQVRDMAKIYSEFANGGSNLNIKKETIEELSKPPKPTNNGWKDVVLTGDTAFSLGFFKPIETGSNYGDPSCFGHHGAGGSFCFADPVNKVGFAYGMTKVGMQMFDDPRELALRKAFYSCI